MSCADDALLWAHHEGSLPEPERALLERHLVDCEGCRMSLVRLSTTRALLQAAAQRAPSVAWRRVDEAVMADAAAQLRHRAARWPVWALGGVTAVAALAALAVFSTTFEPAPPAALPVAQEQLSAQPPDLAVVVEGASGAHLSLPRAEEEDLAAGARFGQGARIRTAEGGWAKVLLPDASRAFVGPGTDALLEQATADTVLLRLGQGLLALEASPQPRERFTVQTQELSVRVVGTVFSVARAEGRLVVAVARGRVEVERQGDGEVLGLEGGQRLVLGAGGQWNVEPLSAQDAVWFEELGVVDLLPPKAQAAAGPSTQRARSPRPPPPLPQDPPPPAPLPPAAPGPPVGEVSDWVTPDFQGTPAQAAARSPQPVPTPRPSRTAEDRFLGRAEASLHAGQCRGFLVGLADVAENSQDEDARGKARIFRARCYGGSRLPANAEAEYRRYLEQHPDGPFAEEARGALAR
jgi:hypothetical protein